VPNQPLSAASDGNSIEKIGKNINNRRLLLEQWYYSISTCAFWILSGLWAHLMLFLAHCGF
jgi:hypothetical protein